jgi:hypothetical protein
MNHPNAVLYEQVLTTFNAPKDVIKGPSLFSLIVFLRLCMLGSRREMEHTTESVGEGMPD